MTYDFDFVHLSSVWEQDADYPAGFTLKWSAKNMGFGELTFFRGGGEDICETECMSRDFVDQAIKFWLDNIKMVDI